MTNRILEKNFSHNQKIDSISVPQFEYTASTLLTYGTITIAVVATIAAVIYMGVQQLKK